MQAQLPMGMLDDDFLRRFVGIFQEMASSLLDGADNLDNVVDVTVTPAPLVPWLGSWLGITSIDASLPHELQRRIVRETARMLAWRGTRRGLEAFLSLITGGPVEVVESGGVRREGEAPAAAPAVVMRVASTGWVPEEDFVTLVRDELPAHVGFALFVGERRLWPPDQARPVPEVGDEDGGSSSAVQPAGVSA